MHACHCHAQRCRTCRSVYHPSLTLVPPMRRPTPPPSVLAPSPPGPSNTCIDFGSSTNCFRCSNSTTCAQCNNAYLYEGVCLAACPVGTTPHTESDGRLWWCTTTPQPTLMPTTMPTFDPCSGGAQNTCDVVTTYCSQIPSSGRAYTCECRKGFMHTTASVNVCVATPAPTMIPTSFPTTLQPTHWPTTSSPTYRPTDEPTFTPCSAGHHNCDLTSTYCASVSSGGASFTCECLEG
jgi:hypothetical protein